jgi:membrane-bound lytic murein transglycosylase D
MFKIFYLTRNPMSLAHKFSVVSLGVLIVLLAPVHADPLPRPAGLEPEIAFWRSVFAEVTSDQAIIHDNRHLNVVYEVTEIPADSSSRRRRAISDRLRKKYSGILNGLAAGKREGLTTNERRVLELWPDDVSNDELRKAAKRVRFQQGLADRFYEGLIRSGRWENYIRKALRAEGVPESLASLPHVESSFNPAARSHVGASGLWQFTRSTGKRFMEIDHVVDERRDPYLSSDAAARLLSYNYSILNSWSLAITAYNHGVAGMRRAVKSMGTDDIEVIIRNYSGRSFGFASRNFYVAFLAANEVEMNAELYFGPIKKESPGNDSVVIMPYYVSASTLETTLGVSRATLEAYNPALMPPVWNDTKYVPRGYELRIPAAATANQTPKQILAGLPANRRFDEQTPDLYHKVQRGDSLSVISVRYRTSVSELVSLNDLKSRHHIRAGQVLRLPYKGPRPAQPIPENASVYKVRSGDSIGTIAQRAGMTAEQLLAMNSISNRNRIYPGQELMLAKQAASDLPAERPVEDAPDSEMLAAPVAEPEVVQLLADPSDYSVQADGSIEIQAAETLGHFANWSAVSTQRLRDLNDYSFRQPVVMGRRLKLDLSKVNAETFTARRTNYHRELQEAFFTRYRITETTTHTLRRGESVWVLTQRRYKVPVWLLHQYNPDLDLSRVRPGTKLVFPRIEPVSVSGEEPSRLAGAA